MEELKRIEAEISQMKGRVDDLSYRVAVVETQQKGIDGKLDLIRSSINEKLDAMNRNIEKQASNINWGIKTFLGVFILGFGGWIVTGGLSG